MPRNLHTCSVTYNMDRLTHAHTYPHTCTCSQTHAITHTKTHCIHIYIHTGTHATCICARVRANLCTHVHTHVHSLSHNHTLLTSMHTCRHTQNQILKCRHLPIHGYSPTPISWIHSYSETCACSYLLTCAHMCYMNAQHLHTQTHTHSHAYIQVPVHTLSYMYTLTLTPRGRQGFNPLPVFWAETTDLFCCDLQACSLIHDQTSGKGLPPLNKGLFARNRMLTPGCSFSQAESWQERKRRKRHDLAVIFMLLRSAPDRRKTQEWPIFSMEGEGSKTGFGGEGWSGANCLCGLVL